MRSLTTLILASLFAVSAAAQRPEPAPRPVAPVRVPATAPVPVPEREPASLMDWSRDGFFPEHALDLARDAMLDVDWQGARMEALDAARVAMRDVDRQGVRIEAPDAARYAMLDVERQGAGSVLTSPPAPSGPQDASDSLYRVAREMLNRGEYRRAADTFRLLGERYPTSRYAADARYWQAFALYRIGTVADMRVALAALEAQRAESPRASTHASAATLRARILGELASQGDAAALASVRQNAQRSGDSCDRDEMAVRVEALNALSRLDPAATTTALRRVLGQRDECSVSVRRRAVFLLGRQADAGAGDLLLDVIRNDPDASVRADAIAMVARVPSDRSIAHLEDVARSGDSRLASAALSALASTEHPRGRVVLRQIIERQDASESVRSDAIYVFRTDKATAEDIAFLRSVYPRLESRRLKERTIAVVARHPSPENLQWLTTLSGNRNEPVSIRAAAVAQFGRAPTPIAEVLRLYDSLGERQLKEQVITTLAGRKEPEAVDKLIAIARGERDPQVRRAAIARLAQKNDPRTTQLLLEIIDQ